MTEAIAQRMATLAHRGQVDRQGAPYIAHVEYVARNVATSAQRTVAWLHDVVEDTDVTLEQLAVVFPAQVVNAVDAITRRMEETYAEYIHRLKRDPLAAAVKRVDLRHNMNRGTIPPSLMRRYEKALAVLSA